MNNLKKIRKEKQLTQQQLADLLNVSQKQVSRLEREENPLNANQIIKLCEVLNCSADYLLGINEKVLISGEKI